MFYICFFLIPSASCFRLILTNLSLYYVCRKRSPSSFSSSSVVPVTTAAKVASKSHHAMHEMTEVVKANQPNRDVSAGGGGGGGGGCRGDGSCDVGRMSRSAAGRYAQQVSKFMVKS